MKKLMLTFLVISQVTSILFCQFSAENFSLLARYIPQGGSAIDIDFYGNYALLIGKDIWKTRSELEIIDIEDLENPTLFKRISFINGDKIMVRKIWGNSDSLDIAAVKTSNGVKFIELSTLDNDTVNIYDFYIEGIKDFVIRDNFLLSVSDSSINIYSIVELNSGLGLQFNKSIITSAKNNAITLCNNFIYLGQDSGLAVINISDFQDVNLEAELNNYNYDCPFNMNIYGGVHKDNYLYMISRSCLQLFIFDISIPNLPQLIDYSPLVIKDEWMSGIFIANDFLYTSVYPHHGGALWMYDISEPKMPVQTGFFSNIPKPGGGSIKVRDNIVFFCGYENTDGDPSMPQCGLFILKNDLITLADEVEKIPKQYNLSQNYPNPFNPSTIISYSVPNTNVISNPQRDERSPNSVTVRDENTKVTLKVYDILGKEIATLVNKNPTPGKYQVEFDASTSSATGSNLPSGVYFYRLQAGDFLETKKMVLLR